MRNGAAELELACEGEPKVSSDFAEAVRANLPGIDSILTRWEIDPSERPLRAAYFFVQECITTIEGDTKDDCLSKAWFGDIYRVVHRWYVERYGDRLQATRSRSRTGLILFLDTVFKVTVPIVTTEPGPEKWQRWICFPDEVLPGENPVKWLTEPPSLKNLTLSERQELDEKIRCVANAIRECSRGIALARKPDGEMEALASSIPEHLVRGAELILGTPSVRALAVWELHLAAEKALKLVLRQLGLQVAKTHQLTELAAMAQAEGFNDLPRSSLSLFPSSNEAIAHRYGEAPPVPLPRLVEIYWAALSVCSACCRALSRPAAVSRNMRYLIRALPFTTAARDGMNDAG